MNYRAGSSSVPPLHLNILCGRHQEIEYLQKVTFFKNKYIELHLGEESIKFS